jgi:hypothetical protein
MKMTIKFEVLLVSVAKLGLKPGGIIVANYLS